LLDGRFGGGPPAAARVAPVATTTTAQIASAALIRRHAPNFVRVFSPVRMSVLLSFPPTEHYTGSADMDVSGGGGGTPGRSSDPRCVWFVAALVQILD